MKTAYKIMLSWFVFVVFYICARLMTRSDLTSWSNGITLSSSALVAIVSFFVSQKEIEKGNRAAFFNFALIFGVNALLTPAYVLLSDTLLSKDAYATVYFNQYNYALYQFLLSLSVVFAVLHSIRRNWKTYRKYVLSLIVVGCGWLYLFLPYLSDPRFLYSTEDVQLYRLIDKALSRFHETEDCQPTSREIAESIRLFWADDRGERHELVGIEKERRVAELMPYMDGDNHRILILRPLNRNIFLMGLMNLTAIIVFIAFHYLKDPPKGAYLEKVILLMLPYCTFETVHAYVFSNMHSTQAFLRAFALGQMFSVATMLMLILVFCLRLRFLSSIEGRYYESHLVTDPAHITRWRDAFDNWVLRQFMNPGELEQRFLIQGQGGEKGEHHKEVLNERD